jgi:anaerobic ribonucleoside-triphosphate reductase activating protein
MNYRDKESNTSVLINLIYAPVLTLGPGIRVGVWFQGCSIRCKGCISKHTWEFDKKYKKTIAQVIDQINYYSEIYNTKSITISGGEPFDQSSSLYILLKKLKELKFNDILLYSGYKFNYLQKNYGDILKYIDVLIDGPFIESKKTNKIYKGSNNQRMYILNKSLSPIYQEYKKQLKNKKLQLITKDNETYLIGIPEIDFSKKFSKNLIKKL